MDSRAFVPIRVESARSLTGQEISIEIRRGATLVKLAWPLSGATDCAAWLREWLR